MAKSKDSFVKVKRKMLKDKEWRQLSNSAKIIWIYMRSKYNKNTMKEAAKTGKIEITLAYSEIDDMFSSATIRKSFLELENANFIEKTKLGGLYGGVCRYKFKGKYKDFENKYS